jgi:hypothetical protein
VFGTPAMRSALCHECVEKTLRRFEDLNP